MKDTKDNFTAQAGEYAKFRPSYPAEMYSFLYSLVNNRQAAWDCGTGNGQVATELSTMFDRVYATDISDRQIANAPKTHNIVYSVQRAESTNFAANSFDLVTVAQAIHWFDFDAFYQEVRRTMNEGGVLAVIGYGLLRVNDAVDEILDNFYRGVIGPYWDKERKWIDENYATIPFPFDVIPAPRFRNQLHWTLEDFTGYLGTWSAVQHYRSAKREDPVALITKELENAWPAGATNTVEFPILFRAARLAGA